MSQSAEILPSWLRSANPPHANARSDEKVRWIRKEMRGFANVMALEEIYQIGPYDYNDAPGQVMLGCVGYAKRVGYPGSIGWTAYLAEWPEAKERARLFADALRKAVWTMGRDRAPGFEILARAKSVNQYQHDRFGIDLATDDLIEVTRMIAVAAATGRKPHGRRL
ncbi:hypothetical protein ACELLULO517_07635 [Acidisoma cellulosilytica]|uniref:Uncharacterized protein n=1 Tax=Acidisoma cellulosilyticum TaxID=2802395 RepID=A0A963YZK4_9PROT|nr:hypothetical protein [Acidisoma cellulosilyticum]MCB8880102.1 hypothetical protein [Acidisoma cellulosilyticum]